MFPDNGDLEFSALINVNTTQFTFDTPQAALAACKDVSRVIQLARGAKIQLGDLGAIESGSGGPGTERGIELARSVAGDRGAGLPQLSRQENVHLLRAYLHTRLEIGSGNAPAEKPEPVERPSSDPTLKTATLFSRSVTGDFLESTFSFEFGTRDNQHGPGQDWDVQYTNGKFLAQVNHGDGSRIVDLGQLTWDQVRLVDLPELPARAKDAGAPAIAGHIYLVHTIDANSDLYSLFRVERQAEASCDITWKVIRNDFGFEFVIRDVPRRVGNEWVVEFSGGKFIAAHVMDGKIRIATVGGDRARIVDLGDLRWRQLALDDLPKPPARLQPGPDPGVSAIRNHIYWVHTVDGNPPRSALFRVEHPEGHPV